MGGCAVRSGGWGGGVPEGGLQAEDLGDRVLLLRAWRFGQGFRRLGVPARRRSRRTRDWSSVRRSRGTRRLPVDRCATRGGRPARASTTPPGPPGLGRCRVGRVGPGTPGWWGRRPRPGTGHAAWPGLRTRPVRRRARRRREPGRAVRRGARGPAAGLGRTAARTRTGSLVPARRRTGWDRDCRRRPRPGMGAPWRPVTNHGDGRSARWPALLKRYCDRGASPTRYGPPALRQRGPHPHHQLPTPGLTHRRASDSGSPSTRAPWDEQLSMRMPHR